MTRISRDSRDNGTAEVAAHPMRDFLRDLRVLEDRKEDREFRQQLGAHAHTVMGVCQNGVAGLGHLLAHSAVVIEDGTVDANSVESIGWLLAELCDLATYCLMLSSEFGRDNVTDRISQVGR